MNAVISLCHFCELHGPNILFATQVFHEIKQLTSEEKPQQFYGQTDAIAVSSRSLASHCEACHALGPPEKAYLSNDHQNRISFLSSREAPGSEAANLLRQACFRSLSCEGSPGREGPTYFGDETRGHALSRPFRLEDAHARGFSRWFSLVILMRDRTFLLNSWPFLLERLEEIIQALQSKAHQVREKDCKPPLRPSNPKISRSLAELTGSEDIFSRLHIWFTWILRAGGNRLTERINLPLNFNFINVIHNFRDFDNSGPIEIPLDYNEPGSSIAELRRLRNTLGVTAFRSVLYCLLLGRQIVVRADSSAKTRPLITAFKALLPSRNIHIHIESNEYITPDKCNLLSLGTEVAVPKPCQEVARLDLLPPQFVINSEGSQITEHWRLLWGGELPSKCPTLLNKIDKAIDNPVLSDKVVECQINAFREEWSNIAQTILKIESESEKMSLLKILGAQEHDWQVIQFWAEQNLEEGSEMKNGILI